MFYSLDGFGATTGNKQLANQQNILQFSDRGILERATDLNGKELTTPKTVIFDGKQIAFEKDGVIRKSGLTGKRAYPQSDGTEQNAIHYYSVKDGAHYTGWKTINEKNITLKMVQTILSMVISRLTVSVTILLMMVKLS